MSEYHSAFFTVPSRILELPGLTLAFLKIYETIYQFWEKGRECYLSNTAIMKRINCSSDSTVREAFIFFEGHQELKRVERNGRRYLVRPERKIAIDDDQSHAVDNSKDPVAKSTPPRRQIDAPPVAKSTVTNIKKYNNNNINKNSCSNEETFNQFYSAYPKKVGKLEAIQAWKKINPKLLPIILNDIKNRLNNDNRWKNKQYIPNPATYLNKKRWEDEIIKQPEEKTVVEHVTRSAVNRMPFHVASKISDIMDGVGHE